MTMIHNAQTTFAWYVPIFNVQTISLYLLFFSLYVIQLNLLPGLSVSVCTAQDIRNFQFESYVHSLL